MTSHSLYRRWRSQNFAELVGQEHVTRTLLNALRQGRVAHAYLFCGPRGTGKTSTARILAKALNCLRNEGRDEPCNECTMCRAIAEGRAFDLIEIDAASNRGIDDIRDLREKVGFAPSEARNKFYIIDEAHMLTTEAFNALLKTLEEPPPHTVLVLATTEAHRIPATIASRCQRFDFRRIALHPAVERLSYICQQEGLQISKEALGALVKAAGGSLRDAQNLLDQLVARYGTEADLPQVQGMLGMTGDRRVSQFAGHLLRREVEPGLRALHGAVDDGVDLRQFNRELLEYLRGLLLVKLGVGDQIEASPEELADLKRLATGADLARLTRTLKLFAQVEMRPDWQSPLPLELALVEMALDGAEIETVAPAVEAKPRVERRPAAPEPVIPVAPTPRPAEPVAVRPDTPTPAASPVPVSTLAGPENATGSTVDVPAPELPAAAEMAGDEEMAASAADPSDLAAHWPRVLEALHGANKTIEALLRSCEAQIVDGTVVLDFFYPYHREKMEDVRYRKVLEEVLARVLGQSYPVRCTFTARDRKAKLEAAADDPLVKAARELFGAKVVDVQ